MLDTAATLSSPTDSTEPTARSEEYPQKNPLRIVPPNKAFQNTAGKGAEVSIVSMNLLAPFYNSLQLNQKTTTDYERWEFLDHDRTQRVPMALNMAKRTNADVLCLQEIEGGKLGEASAGGTGEFTLRDDIREWLAEPTVLERSGDGNLIVLDGYDSFVWSPLNPGNKRGDVVGLCIAWRSQKHSLVNWQGYRRGMVCRLEARDNNADQDDKSETYRPSFALANLHLPARPSNVLGRLKTMSRTIQKLSGIESEMQKDRVTKNASNANIHNTIDGLMIVAGDFNSDQNSVAARLLTHGYTNYGNVRDRNYKAKITKASATDMSHPYRFLDSYDHGDHPNNQDTRFKNGSFRDLYAPVTVSLKGRGPGIMDHLFYATGSKQKHNLYPPKIRNTRKNPSRVAAKTSRVSTADTLSASLLQQSQSKRTKRRKKGESRGGGGNEAVAFAARYAPDPRARIKIKSVLATVDAENGDEERLEIIRAGLPNAEEGFPSDHLPVGALFSASGKSIEPIGNGDNDDGGNVGSTMTMPTSEAVSDANVLGEADRSDNETTSVLENSSNSQSNGGDKGDSNSRTKGDQTSQEGLKERRIKTSLPSGVSSSVQRRRNNSRTSYGLRRRHNMVLNAITDWLVGRGATSVVLDKPLYKNDLLTRVLGESSQKLKKKSRAPDLMCMVVNAGASTDIEECLVVVEVAVASDPNKVRMKKQSKYKDLVELLTGSSSQRQCCFAAVVVGDDGHIPDGTRADIRSLAQLTIQASGGSKSPDEATKEVETELFCTHLQSLVASLRK